MCWRWYVPAPNPCAVKLCPWLPDFVRAALSVCLLPRPGWGNPWREAGPYDLSPAWMSRVGRDELEAHAAHAYRSSDAEGK